MHSLSSLRTPAVSAVTVALMGLALAACASNPPGEPAQQQASEVEPTGLEAYTGRLVVIVTDQNATTLDRASVDLRSTGRSMWRRAGTTDTQGRATFSEVPPNVELSVVSQYGSYTQQIVVPQSGGAAEIRVIIQSFGIRDELGGQVEPDAGF